MCLFRGQGWPVRPRGLRLHSNSKRGKFIDGFLSEVGCPDIKKGNWNGDVMWRDLIWQKASKSSKLNARIFFFWTPFIRMTVFIRGFPNPYPHNINNSYGCFLLYHCAFKNSLPQNQKCVLFPSYLGCCLSIYVFLSAASFGKVTCRDSCPLLNLMELGGTKKTN